MKDIITEKLPNQKENSWSYIPTKTPNELIDNLENQIVINDIYYWWTNNTYEDLIDRLKKSQSMKQWVNVDRLHGKKEKNTLESSWMNVWISANWIPAYVISGIDTNDKYSEGYQNCTGIILFGKNWNGENISLLSHQKPEYFLNSENFKNDLEHKLTQFCKEVKDIQCFIVWWNVWEPWNNLTYQQSISCLKDILKSHKLIPKILPPNNLITSEIMVNIETKNNKINILRPKQNILQSLQDKLKRLNIELDLWPIIAWNFDEKYLENVEKYKSNREQWNCICECIQEIYKIKNKDTKISPKDVISEEQSLQNLKYMCQKYNINYEGLDDSEDNTFISINFDPSHLEQILKEGYQSCFLNGSWIGFWVKRLLREKEHHCLFSGIVYGALCTTEQDRIFWWVSAWLPQKYKFSNYGSCYIKLKDDTKKRCTGTLWDTYCWEGMLTYKDCVKAKQILENIPPERNIQYIDMQIYWWISPKDIDSVHYTVFDAIHSTINDEQIQKCYQICKDYQKPFILEISSYFAEKYHQWLNELKWEIAKRFPWVTIEVI